MIGLTDRQSQILATIEVFHHRHGYGPPLRRLALDLGLASVATVHQHCRSLVKKGRLKFAGRLGYVPVESKEAART